MLPLIFKTESILNQLHSFPLPLSVHVLVCSQMLTSLCQTEISRGRCKPAEATQGRYAVDRRAQCSGAPGPAEPEVRCGLAPTRPAPPVAPLLTHAAPPPPGASGVASRPSSHTLSIRCVYFFPDSRHIWSTYSGYSSATRHIPQDHFSGCYGDLPPSSDFQVA